MGEIQEMTKKINRFREERNWNQFHNPKDVALSLTLEAAEVVEHFQWKTKEEVAEYVNKNRDEIGEELADVLWWVLLLSHDLQIELVEAFNKKLRKNDRKYPVEKVKGQPAKYTYYELKAETKR
jgi:NTP pyrophosphatase (non-canonical NTP hydrolase)